MCANAQNLLIKGATIVARSCIARNAWHALFFLIHLERFVMTQLKRLSVFLLAIVFAAALGCAGSATQESTGEYVTDSWITTKVKAALVEDSQVKATEVNVETFKGVVQLSGFVSSNAAMYQAIRVASGIKGVTSVRNDMRIK
jgi:BON domain